MLNKILEHDIAVIFFFTFICALGAAALLTIETNLLPSYKEQALTIITDYYGMEPGVIEEMITKPVERVLREIDGIRDVYSISQKGRSKIIVYLSPEQDIDRMAVVIMDGVYHVSDSFPQEVQEPALYTYNTDDSPVMIISLDERGLSNEELLDHVERNVKPKLMSIDGISNIDLVGPGRKEYMLDLSYSGLMGLGVNYEEVLEKIASGNASLPAGRLSSGQERVPVTFQNRYVDLKNLPSHPINIGGRLFNGHNLFSVSSHRREEERVSFVNNREALTLYIFKKDRANILDVYRDVRETLRGFRGSFSYEFIYDQAESFGVLLSQLMTGALVALGAVFAMAAIFYKKLFYAAIIALSIPLCFAATFILLKLAGKSLNLMTLTGLIVGMGMCAGNCIIVIEAFHESAGKLAIAQAVEKVHRPVLSSTLITVIVFLPLFFIGNKTLSLYTDFAIAISSMLLFSCAVSLVFIPALMLRFCKRRDVPEATPNGFAAKLEVCVRSNVRRLYRSPVIVLALFFLCGCGFLFALVKTRYEETWPLKEQRFEFHYEFDPEYSRPYKEKVLASIGEEILGMRLPLMLVSKLEGEKASFFLKFTGTHKSYMNGIRRLKEYLSLSRREDGFFYIPEGRESGVRSLQLSFFCDNLERLDNFVDSASVGLAELEGVRQVLKGYRKGKPQIDLTPLQGTMAYYGITASDVIQFLRFVFYHPVVMKHYDRGEVSDVRGKIRIEDFRRDDIASLRIPGERMPEKRGFFIPLGDLVDISYSTGPGSITRKNGKRYISMEIFYEGVGEQALLTALRSYLKGLRFERDVYYEFDPELIELRQSTYTFIGALGLALFLIYVVLGIALKSFSDPLAILCTIPSIFVGSTLFLWMGQYTRSAPVHMALMLLAGLSARSTIILAGQVSDARARALDEALSMGYVKSMRILLMLALVMAAAFVPVFFMATSTYFFRVVTGVVGTGMVLSLVISLAVFPALFRVFYLRRTPVCTREYWNYGR